MKVRKNHTRFLCGSLAAAAAISPILSITAWADNISTANFNLRQQVVKLTGIMEISSFRESVTRADFAKNAGKGIQLPRKSANFQCFCLRRCAGNGSKCSVYPHCSKRRLDEWVLRWKIQAGGSGPL